MVNIGIGNGLLIILATATACVWSGCAENQDGSDATSATKRVENMTVPNPRVTRGELPVIQLDFRSATYRLTSDTTAEVTVRLAAFSSRAKTTAYLRLPYAYEVESLHATPRPITAGPGRDSPEMQLYTLTARPQDVLVILRTTQFNLQPSEIKAAQAVAFRLRYSYQGTTSNWIDCQAVRELSHTETQGTDNQR